jgi:hypothetical protein
LNSQSWKTRIVLYPADALFGDRKEQLAIAHNACGRIMLPVVVEAECNHSEVRFISSRFLTHAYLRLHL